MTLSDAAERNLKDGDPLAALVGGQQQRPKL